MSHVSNITAEEALEKLKQGNLIYQTAETCSGDISPKIRLRTCKEGQTPYAIIVTCSDSRVIPESIFNAGIGDLFVIRVAGNVIDRHQLGSIEYAADHLGSPLVVILGHTHCGAVDAAIHHDPDGCIKYITDDIKEAIGDETDPDIACRLNVENSMKHVTDCEHVQELSKKMGLKVMGAIYDIESGKVEFL